MVLNNQKLQIDKKLFVDYFPSPNHYNSLPHSSHAITSRLPLCRSSLPCVCLPESRPGCPPAFLWPTTLINWLTYWCLNVCVWGSDQTKGLIVLDSHTPGTTSWGLLFDSFDRIVSSSGNWLVLYTQLKRQLCAIHVSIQSKHLLVLVIVWHQNSGCVRVSHLHVGLMEFVLTSIWLLIPAILILLWLSFFPVGVGG